jgi:hypothetical protein
MSGNSTPKAPTIKRVTSEQMCKRFNDGSYWAKVLKGEWTAHVLESNISHLLTSETVEITSVMLSYHDENGDERARVHQFMRPDGTLAASGKPDPKRLLENGILYRLEKGPKKPPESK